MEYLFDFRPNEKIVIGKKSEIGKSIDYINIGDSGIDKDGEFVGDMTNETLIKKFIDKLDSLGFIENDELVIPKNSICCVEDENDGIFDVNVCNVNFAIEKEKCSNVSLLVYNS